LACHRSIRIGLRRLKTNLTTDKPEITLDFITYKLFKSVQISVICAISGKVLAFGKAASARFGPGLTWHFKSLPQKAIAGASARIQRAGRKINYAFS
jgi:hypothetical protein